MTVPFVDLKKQYQSIQPEIDKAIQSVIDNTAFVGGPYVKAFEKEFAEKMGMRHCIGVANGTDAIYIVLKMLGIGEGDEVITVANSWISTSETITQAGAKPVFVDVDEYFTIDVRQIEGKITSKTKAIIPVHIYGQPADLDALNKICKARNLILIEDCAQAHFSEYRGQYTGTFGRASTFSFYPGKNLGAYGDAGCIMTNDDCLAEKCRMYANHGALKKHHHLIEGINSRIDSLHASILSAKLKHLSHWNGLRGLHARRYTNSLQGINEITLPKERIKSVHTYHLYVIKTKRRDELKAHLEQAGIETSIHYPTALPLLPCYQYLGHSSGDFPVAHANQQEILSLPMFPELTNEQIEFVSESIRTFYPLYGA